MNSRDSPEQQGLPTKHCSVCDCYVNIKNLDSHMNGKTHRKKAAKVASTPSRGVKRSVDQASLSRSGAGGGSGGDRGGAGTSKSADRPNPRASVLDWLIDMRDHCASHVDFTRQYSALQTGAQLSTSTSSALWSAFGKGADGDSKSSSNTPLKVFGIDCEMVLCEQLDDTHTQRNRIGEVGTQAKVLARVSVVEWEWDREQSSDGGLCKSVLAFAQGKPVKRMDEFVRLPNDVTVIDYLTHVSGVEEQHLKDATLKLSDVHAALGSLLDQQDLVIGHSLWADFEALQMFHSNFLDTAMLFTIQNIANFTPSLKDVVDVMFETTTSSKSTSTSAATATTTTTDISSKNDSSSEQKDDATTTSAPPAVVEAATTSPTTDISNSNNNNNNDDDDATTTSAPTAVVEEKKTAPPSHGFQTHGNSHDSVEDAAWAVRVLALRLSMDDGKLFNEATKNSSALVPYSLPVLPPRFKQRITFQRLPKGSTPETVSALLLKVMGPTFQLNTVTLRPLKWIEPMINGERLPQGSCIVEFPDTDTAITAFTALPCAPFEGKYPRSVEGYPDRNRFLRKFTPLPSDHECEVLSYVRVGGTKPWHTEQIQQSLVGKLMGKRGRRLLMIQQCSGCLVQVNQVRASAANGKRSKTEGKSMAVIEYWAGSLEKAMRAREQVALALCGNDLGIV